MVRVEAFRSRDGRALLALGAVVVLSRLVFAAIGVRFDASTLPISWQFLDVPLLRDDLLASLWHQHGQPPLFNLFLGGVLQLAPERYGPVFHGIYAVLGLAIYSLIYLVLRRFGWGVGLAFGAATVFALSPGALVYEHWLFYTWPLAALLLAAGYALARWEDGRLRDASFFLAALVAVCWMRSAFHVVYLVACIGLVWALRRDAPRRALVAISGVAVGLVVLVLVKNLLLFGSFASSSWMGMSLWRIAGQGHPDVPALVDSGALPEIAAIDAYSPVASYPEAWRQIPERFADVPALTVEKKSYGQTIGDGFDNMNHIAYVDLSAEYRRAAVTMIRHDPLGYARRVMLAWGTYCKPSWEYDFNAHNRPVLRGYIDAVTLAAPRFALERAILGREARYIFPLSSLAVIPLAFMVVMVAAVAPTRRIAAGVGRRGDAFLVFAALTIAYVAMVGNLLELGENHRFRVVTDPLLYIATLVAVRRWLIGR